jgi:hypothetical protein
MIYRPPSESQLGAHTGDLFRVRTYKSDTSCAAQEQREREREVVH